LFFRIQEHYRRLQEKQRQIDQHPSHHGQYQREPEQLPQTLHGHPIQRGAESMPLTREERIQQLRAEHQRKHQERHGRYPHEDKEEEYEEEINKSLDDKVDNVNIGLSEWRSGKIDV
jgi:hypothetical protein